MEVSASKYMYSIVGDVKLARNGFLFTPLFYAFKALGGVCLEVTLPFIKQQFCVLTYLVLIQTNYD